MWPAIGTVRVVCLSVISASHANISETKRDKACHVLDELGVDKAAGPAVSCFKSRLDKFWSNQEVLYNYKEDLHGTGNRSILD